MYINFKDQTTDMNRVALFGFNKFLQEYDILASYKIDEGQNKPTILGAKEFKCRFCGKSKPETTFRNRAHALPEFIGNSSLLSHYECDNCNSRFGRELESQFANFMQLNHTMFAVKGKSGFPKFKLTNGTSIKSDGKLIDWDGIPNDKLSYDNYTSTLVATQKVPSFVPVAVYKALLKMALTIMPHDELKTFSETMNWLNAPIHNNGFEIQPLWVLYGSLNSNDRFPHIGASLLKRKNLKDFEIAPMLFRLNYANFQFDLPLPLFYKGKMIPLKQMPYLPNLFDLRDGYGTLDMRFIDFSYGGVISDHSMTFTLVDQDGTGIFETTSI
jgi:hypothetical protein